MKNSTDVAMMAFFAILIVIAFAIRPDRARADDFDTDDCGTAHFSPGLGNVQPLLARAYSGAVPAAPCLDCGESVSYTAFNGTPYTLTRYQGAFVEILLPDSWEQAGVLTDSERRLLIDRADFRYAHTSELLAREPAGTGRLTIAFIDSTCGLGCGWIGSKGVEILSTQSGIDHVQNALAAGVIPGAISHEMMHNFDVYNAYLFDGNGTPGGHAWTEFIGIYLDTYTRMGTPTQGPDDRLATWLDTRLAPYLEEPAATWASCVSTGSCPAGLTPDQAWAGVSNHFASLHGPLAVQSFFAELDGHATTHPPGATLQEKADLHVEMMARAANADLRCYVDHWKWSISPALEGQLASYPNPSMCSDFDFDGRSPLEGDCDDGDDLVFPGAIETLNGIDDDCNDVVDDLLSVEPAGGDFSPNLLVNYPSAVEGVIDVADHDDFTFDLPFAQDVEVRVCSEGFQGFLFVLNEDNSWFDYQFVTQDACGSRVYALDEARVWRFDIALNVASNPGPYRVSIRPANTWPPVDAWGDADPVTGPVFPVTLGTQSIPSAPAFPPTHARFWVSGLGFVDSVPYANSATTTFDPGPNGSGEYRYRVQLSSNGRPATDWSTERSFVPEPTAGSALGAGVIAIAIGAQARRRRFVRPKNARDPRPPDED